MDSVQDVDEVTVEIEEDPAGEVVLPVEDFEDTFRTSGTSYQPC